MRCYQVQVPGCKKRFAGTQAEVRTLKAELMEACVCDKKQVQVTEVEVLLAKDELLSFLNELAAEGDK